MKHKEVLLLLICLTVSYSVFAQQDSGKRYLLPSWQTKAGEIQNGTSSTLDRSGWNTITLPAQLLLENNSAWIYREFDFNDIPFRQPYYMVLGRIDAAYEVFLNDSFIASRGHIPTSSESFSLPGNQSACFLLPSGLVKTSGKNQLAIRLYCPARAVPLFPIEITDARGAQFENQIVSFLNATVYTILAALCGFIGVYFFALWLARKTDKPNLWYAIAAISVAFYFAEIGADTTLLPYTVNRAIAKFCLSISMSSLVQFFMNFLTLKIPRWFSWLLLLIPTVITIAFLASSNDLIAIGNVFNAALLFIQFCILFIAIITIWAVIKGNKEAVPLLIGVILGVGLGTHDVLYSMLGKKPLMWLQGIGFFCMNLSLFISLTFRSSHLYKDLESYSQEVHKKTEQLSQFIEQLDKTAQTVVSLSQDIDEDAGKAANSAETMAKGAEQIRQGANTQMKAMLESRQSIQNFTLSLDKVTTGVHRQAEGIKQSADSISVVADAVANVATHMEQTARSAEALQESAEQGLAASREMTESIGKIKNLSGTMVSRSSRRTLDSIVSIRNALSSQQRASEQLKKSIDAIVQENSSIVQLIQELAQENRKGQQAVASMRKLLETRTA
ncbi:7TM diverse intracellular signaling domain-containing protein [Gracilinema caldarium]|uniref:Diverse 7TM receptor transmembrane region n=1 Tax=Gracilinema caldarium (strain ATCC 51460 / DSM 7334 / H1) TaxID=744872 RepID=F8F0L2_GRAC1|nr:7TM diverse intracellular signaling domain-containing protein [Gracilinema caldarium]AEJ19719.1 Diverse 7TM receptor transmembrane region [Gracilinema caldarium DSM 7334]